MRNLKVFLASPSDVNTERRYAEQVISDFNDQVSDNFGVRLALFTWEKLSPDLGEPQRLINEQSNDADLIIVIFHRKFGSPTAEYSSGTFEEFSRGHARWQAGGPGRPRVRVYFKDINKDEAGPEQGLVEFKKWFTANGIGLYYRFPDAEEFRYQFTTQLYRLIVEDMLPSKLDEAGPENFGMLSTIADVVRHGIGDLSDFFQYLKQKRQLTTAAMTINPKSYPIGVYSHGLSIVTTRFWTTAFLDSAYWDGTNLTILTINQKMLGKIKENGGTARRLLLGSMDPEREALWLTTQWRQMEEFGLLDLAAEKRRKFRSLRKSRLQLSKDGFETRVGYDPQPRDAFDDLPITFDEQPFDPTKLGITLYDDIRLDVFQEGRMGVIGSVSCFTPASETFNLVRERAEAYFSSLWENAIDFVEFLKLVDDHDTSTKD